MCTFLTRLYLKLRSLLLFIITTYHVFNVVSSVTTINSLTSSGLFIDDFYCDNIGENGWNNCQQDTKGYHGRFTDSDTDSTTITLTPLFRKFQCNTYSILYIQFSVAFDCGTENNQIDSVEFIFNSQSNYIGCCTVGMAKNGTISTLGLPNFQGQCNINQPWKVQISPIYNLGDIDGYTPFELRWITKTTHINDGILIYNINMECRKPTFDPTFDPTKSPTFDPTSDPTKSPTFDPTQSPTTDPTQSPTTDPSFDPTENPTYDPTYDPIGNVSYKWSTLENTTFIHDAYSKFEIALTMKLDLLKGLNKTKWYFIDVEEYNGGNWTEIKQEIYHDITIYTARIVDEYKLYELGYNRTDMVYTSILSIDALRILNSGYCYNTTKAKYHILQPGKQYMFYLQIIADSIINDRYDEYFDSNILSINTNQFATDGQCILRLLNPKQKNKARLLDRFYFECQNWIDPDSIDANFTLKFNGLMNDVLIQNTLLSELWTHIASDIIGMIGTKALQIKALIRDDLGAITCYDIDIDESFPDAELSDEEILAAVRRVISENKLGHDNAIAVALDTILEGLLYIGYANNDVLQEIMHLIVENVVATFIDIHWICF